MKLSTLEKTIQDAERYIDSAKAAKCRIIKENFASCKRTGSKEHICDNFDWPTKETAAVRRASMDLSRSLTDLRQNR
jgi:hypothetical protein